MPHFLSEYYAACDLDFLAVQIFGMWCFLVTSLVYHVWRWYDHPFISYSTMHAWALWLDCEQQYCKSFSC